MASFANLAGILLALSSALVWGGSDFIGGLATRLNARPLARNQPGSNLFQVMALSAFSGVLILIGCVMLWREPLPSLPSVMWAVMAGVSGAIGIAALYLALSIGQAASVAPTAAVIGTILPVLYSIFTEGPPGLVRLAGFGVALGGIWMVSKPPTQGEQVNRRDFLLACMAGIFFGGFFILIAQVKAGFVFIPLLVSRSASFTLAILLMLSRPAPLPSRSTSLLALLGGALDAGGNVFYLLAAHLVRLDVAVVISSLYPAGTVLLARLLQKEKASSWQWVGVLLCLAAIILISL
jgi:drug/metabolite transporter (DMT)-like permease